MTTKGRFAAGLLLLSTIGLCQATPASALVLSWSPDSVATDFASETATSCTLWIHPSQSGETLLTGEWRLAWSEKTEAHATRLLAVVCAPGVSEACSLASPSDGVSILAHHRIAIVDPSQTASAPLLGCIFAIAADTRAHFRLVQSGKAAAEATIRGGDAVHSPPVIFKALFDPSNVGGALAIHGDFAAQALRAAVVDSAGNVVSACSLGSTIEQWVSLPLMVPGPGFMLRLSDATGAFDLCAITFGDGPTPPAAVNTVVIGFTASTIEAPLNTGQVEIEQFTFNEPSLGDALQNCGVTHLERLVPDFSSTRSTNLIGEPILLEDLSATYIATLEPGASDSAAYNLLKDQPGIYFVHLNRSGQMSQATVNDPLFDTQWALRNVGQSICGADILSGFDLDLVEAWDITFGAAAETVAVVDTGLDTTHEEFSGGHYGLRPGTTSDVDPDRHGTLVAGVIAARANNGVGGTGVAPGCIPLAVGIGLT